MLVAETHEPSRARRRKRAAPNYAAASMRQIHRAGEKTFIDFSGERPALVDRHTGELRRVELFVAVLGASGFTYAEATATPQLPAWVVRDAERRDLTEVMEDPGRAGLHPHRQPVARHRLARHHRTTGRKTPRGRRRAHDDVGW